MLQIIDDLGPWTWWIAGLVLLALEIFVPGNVFVWLGIAAIVTGAVALLGAFGWQVDLIVFGVLALALVIVGRRYFARAAGSEEPLLNQRATRLIGAVHVLSEPIVDGRGRLRIADANWLIAGPDLPSGTRIRITGHDGSVLSVAPTEK
jgi:inner membrane protein